LTGNQRFFEILTRHATGDESINFRIIHTPDKQRRIIKDEIFLSYSKIGIIPSIIEQHKAFNIYFGPALRKPGEGRKEGISHIGSFHCDTDFKDIPRVEAWERLEGFPIRPGAIIETGGGLQLYWWLKVALNSEAFNKRLALYLGGDRGATDISHMMRVPGSINRKPERNNFPVRIIELREDEINPSDLDDILPLLPVIPESRVAITSSPHDWEKAWRLVATKQRIMDHWITPKPEDRSGHDWRLALLCIEEGITDPGLLYQIILHNPYGKASSRRDSDRYIRPLISKCLSNAQLEEVQPVGNTFPLEVITGICGDFANLYSQYIEAPKEFLFFGLLCCMGSVLAGKLSLKSELKPEPRYYLLFLGDSADDRKSTAIKAPVDLMMEFFRDTLHVSWGVGSAEGLQARINEIPGGRLLLLQDEFKSLVSKCKIEGSVLLPCINSLFESNVYESRTKTTDIKLEGAHLSIMGASTKQTYDHLWTSQFLDIGFVNRLMIIPASGQRKFPIPKEIPLDKKKKIVEAIRNAISTVRECHQMEIEPDALATFETWYFGLGRSIHTKRLDGYALRLMPLLALNDGKATVDLDTVRKTISLMDWQKQIREELDPIDAVNEIAALEEKIRRVLKNGPLSTRDLKRAVHASRVGLWIFDQAIRNLSTGIDPEIRINKMSKKWEALQIGTKTGTSIF
jgi:hypothetical protein